MRFVILLIAVLLYIPSIGYAQPPLPIEKPTKISDNFNQLIDDTAVKETTKKLSIITPPPLPDSKKVSANESTSLVNGIPVPPLKPLRVRSASLPNVQPPPIQQKTIIKYRGNNNDDGRTAGRHKIERSQSKPRERIHETTEKSPFKTAQLPRAPKSSSQSEPVILFFKEGSSELEVGQLAVIKSDILNVLRRSPSRKVSIYGYAEKNRSDPDKTNQISLSRALLISEYLADNRISPNRIEARSMGSDTPISPKNRVDVVIY